MVAITSGSNINFERLRLVAELAELGSNAEHMLASTISGAPGSLQAFVETATANKENITELRHRCAAAHVSISMLQLQVIELLSFCRGKPHCSAQNPCNWGQHASSDTIDELAA